MPLENLDRIVPARTFCASVIFNSDDALAFPRSLAGMWIVDAELRRRTLSIIRQRERPLLSKVELVSRKASHLQHAVQAFIDMARAFKFRSTRLIYR